MKKSIVSPVLKSNKNKQLFNSYRCVSVQTNIYRIFENVLLNKMIPFIYMNKIIPDSQYGYRPGAGIHTIHMDIQKFIFKAFNDKNILGIDLVFLDLSDAFDTVSHKLLIKKLYNYGFRGKFLNIIKNTFNDRQQIVKFNDVLSKKLM